MNAVEILDKMIAEQFPDANTAPVTTYQSGIYSGLCQARDAVAQSDDAKEIADLRKRLEISRMQLDVAERQLRKLENENAST